MQAIVETANTIARIFYTMVATKIQFDEKKTGLDEKTLIQRKIAIAQRTLDKLNLKMSATGQ